MLHPHEYKYARVSLSSAFVFLSSPLTTTLTTTLTTKPLITALATKLNTSPTPKAPKTLSIMSWQKEIRPTRENSSLPLYDNAPEAAAEPEPLSRREQRRLRRRTARNFSEVAQVASADDLENETKDGQDDANTTAETIVPRMKTAARRRTRGNDGNPPTPGLHSQGTSNNKNRNHDAQVLNGLNASVYKTPPKGQGEFTADEDDEAIPMMTFWGATKMALQNLDFLCQKTIRLRDPDSQARLG
ncbi:hypothetical protein NW759_011589 [Fusarium solani]|nr:hypothetical protein NW759_011589 [Fusarium solani]